MEKTIRSLPFVLLLSTLCTHVSFMSAADGNHYPSLQQQFGYPDINGYTPSAPGLQQETAQPPYRTQPLPRTADITPYTGGYQNHYQEQYQYYPAQEQQQAGFSRSLPQQTERIQLGHQRTRSRSFELPTDQESTTDQIAFEKLMRRNASEKSQNPEYALQILQEDHTAALDACQSLIQVMEQKKKQLQDELERARRYSLEQKSPTTKQSFLHRVQNVVIGAEAAKTADRRKSAKAYEKSVKPAQDDIFQQAARCSLIADKIRKAVDDMNESPDSLEQHIQKS